MNPKLDLLQPYPFARLRELLKGVEANPDLTPLRLSIGEPEHEPPSQVLKALADSVDGVSKYPATGGTPELKQAIEQWLKQRFKLGSIQAESHILPVNGTREALFAVAQALVSDKGIPGKQNTVLMPNPFYQIYEGAALLSGAKPVFYNLDETTNQPDFDSIPEQDLADCELMYVCTPGNPSGQSISLETLKNLVKLANKHNFVLVSDECYSELYLDEEKPCSSLLQACEELALDSRESALNSYDNCLIFHSLSKRSNLPGLRSGFVAGDAKLIEKFLLYRTYHGSAMALHHQKASIEAWNDEQHVAQNRGLYRAKYQAVMPILHKEFSFIEPDSGFYLWLETPCDDKEFTRSLYEQQNLIVIPGSFLARDFEGHNPGKNRIRLALVGNIDDCVEAANRLCAHAQHYQARGRSQT